MRVSLTGLCGAGQMGLALLALLSVFTGRGDLWSVGQMAEIAMTVGAVPLWSQETGRSGFLRGASPTPPHLQWPGCIWKRAETGHWGMSGG